jgi:hypothetical protein
VLAARRREHEQHLDARARLATRHGRDFDPVAAAEEAINGSPERIARGRSSEDDARRLRGLPVVGGPLGGAIPGTSPHRNAALDRWSGR